MKKAKKSLALVLALVMVLAVALTSGFTARDGEDDLNGFPDKAIRMIIPYAAGGNSDLNARKLAEIIDKYDLLNGQQLVVTNIQGSATQEAFNAVLNADPDGYTLILQHNAILTQPAFGNVTFTMDDVAAVCEVLEQPFMVFADADAPYDNTQELIDYCKEHPDEKIAFGVPGVGSSGQMGIEVYLDQTGLHDNMQYIYYGSGGDSLTGHLAGECVIHGGFATDGMRYVESGELKVLAVSGQERLETLPDVECFGDLGFDTDYMTCQGIWGTKGTPEAIINYLADVFMKACDTEEYRAYLEESGCTYAVAGPEEWHDMMAELDVTIRDLVDRFDLAS